MGQIERHDDRNRNKLQGNITSSKQDRLLVEVASDDRRVQFAVEGHETVDQVKRQALTEMQIPAPNPERYIVIGANRQPLEDNQLLHDMLKRGEPLEFRLIPQVAFGWKKMLMSLFRRVRCLIHC
jgi:hypothetical protein